jgi:NAD(P)-dependent dehydrogenase (short-subunit alcohol dehydrogenase family)
MKDYFNLKGKNILITGASSGIGRQCAIALSGWGANLALVARNRPRLESLCRQLKTKHAIYAYDITQYAGINGIIADAVSRIGKLSGFLHSAGADALLPLQNTGAGVLEELFSVNVVAGLEFARIISDKRYLSPGGAGFVFISSVMGLLGAKGRLGYCASKGALIPAVKAMALELADRKVRVNCLLPGLVETEMSRRMFAALSAENKRAIAQMHPLGLGRPRDIANLCAFLFSDLSRWITGSALVIDGGYSIS